jgi:hypothetical protein
MEGLLMHGRRHYIVLVAILATAGLVSLDGQAVKPPPGSSSGSTSNPGAGTSTSGQPSNIGGNVPTFSSNGIAGRLVPAPSMSVMIELYQDGIRLDSTYSSVDGSFRFPRHPSDRRYELRIQVEPGREVRQEIDFQGGFPAVVQWNAMKWVRTKTHEEEPPAGTVSVVSLLAPKKAQQEFDKGKELGGKKKFDEALTHFQKAVDLYPKYAAAYNEMGQVEQAANHVPAAEEWYRKAIEADPKWPQPYLNLAQSQMTRRDIPGMMQTCEKALALDPSLAIPNYFTAFGYFTMGRLDRQPRSRPDSSVVRGKKSRGLFIALP